MYDFIFYTMYNYQKSNERSFEFNIFFLNLYNGAAKQRSFP
jgi:hypothetical protein